MGKWESRVLGGISKLGGKVGFLTFPPHVFSTTLRPAVGLRLRIAPASTVNVPGSAVRS